MDRLQHNVRVTGVARLGILAFAASILGLVPLASAQFERTLGFEQPIEHLSLANVGNDQGSLSGGHWTKSQTGLRVGHLTRWVPDGTALWERIVEFPGNAEVHAVATASNGDLLVAGETDELLLVNSIFVLRLNSLGQLIWSRVFVGTPFLQNRECVTIRELANSDVIVTGRWQPGGQARPGRLIRLTSTGTTVFDITVGPVGLPGAQQNYNDVRELPDGVLVVAGEFRESTSDPWQTMGAWFAANGASLGMVVYQLPNAESLGDGLDVQAVTGDLIFSGRRLDPITGNAQLRLIRTDNFGNQIWNRFYTHGLAEYRAAHTGVVWGPLGNIVVSGTQVDAAQSRATLNRFNGSGTQLDSTLFGLQAQTTSKDLALTATGQVVMVGSYENGPSGFPALAAYLVRTDTNGDTGCSDDPIAPLTFNASVFTTYQLVTSSVPLPFSFGPEMPLVIHARDWACGGPCYPDCDADNMLSIDDFICFQTFFAVGDPYADCDEDGVLSIDDFICFQTYFAIGC